MLMYVDAHPDKKTLERDGYSVKHLYRVLGANRVLNSLRPVDAHGYCLARRHEGAAAGTINKEIGLLSSALNWGRRVLGWRIDNPAEAQRLPEPPGKDRWLTPEEAVLLVSAANEEPKVADYLPDFIRLGLHTGMRPGEMLKLEWKRVNLQQGRILLGAMDQKSERLGSVPLNQTARDAILSRARFRAIHCPATPWVFCNRRGERLANVRNGFMSAVERAGIAKCTPHDLRRTCGSWLAQAGVPIQQIAKLLRHRDIQVTHSVYAHLMPGQLEETVRMLERHNPVIVRDQSILRL
ncbi:MAG: site-specific integrase [Candidatus Competibacteraceae bacterium]|nr:site-specific integrase [Candidatus Competibacteraceae bacterium]MBK8963337.1 site-specific integrase [Candidatus Competibacteraceae bacterium]